MNIPISSTAASGYVISPRTLSSHNQNAMPQVQSSPLTSQMAVPAHHPNSGQHQQATNNLQFAQSVASLPALVQQQQTMLQTMPAGSLQYPQQQLMIQSQILQPIYQQGGQQSMLMAPQGNFALQQSINQGIAMMQATASQKVQQGIPIQPGKPMVGKASGPSQPVMAGPNHLMMQGPSQQMMTASSQTMTMSAASKIQVVNHKQQNAIAVARSSQSSLSITGESQTPPAMSGQTQTSTTIAVAGPTQTSQIAISTPHPHPQYLAQPSADGRTVLIPMLPQAGNMLSQHQDMTATQQQQQTQQSQQQAQAQQQQQQQQQQVSVAHASQILASNTNQTVSLGQPQIVNSLQAFNAFANGLPWASSQLQGNQVLQPPLQLFRNQSDGSFYFGSPAATAPTNHQQQQQTSLAQPVTIQTSSSMGITELQASTSSVQGANASANALNLASTNGQPVTAVTNQAISQSSLAAANQAQLATRVSMTPPISSVGNNAVVTSTASVEPSVIQSVSNAFPAPSVASKESPRLTPGPWNHPQPFRISRPAAPLQQLGLKVTVMPRGVRGIIPRPPRQNTSNQSESSKNKSNDSKPVGNSASRCAAYDFSEESSDSTLPPSKFHMKTVKSNAPELPRHGSLTERAEQPLVASVPPLDSVQQPINSTLPVAGVPGASETSGSTSPAIAATFPSGSSDLPESHEEASEILTHIVEGFVIREGPVPFPVTRTALLNEILAREQMVMQSIKERKRKHESAVAASNARKPGNHDKNGHDDRGDQLKGTAPILGRSEPTQIAIANTNNKAAQTASRARINTEIKTESAKVDRRNKMQSIEALSRGQKVDDKDTTSIASVIDNVMNSKTLGLNVSPLGGSALKSEETTAGTNRIAAETKNKPAAAPENVKKIGEPGTNETYKDCYTYISGNTDRNSLPKIVQNKEELQEEEKGRRNPVAATVVPTQQKSDSPTGEEPTDTAAEESNAHDQEAGSLNSSNPLTWTVEEVSEFIKTIPGCAMYAEEFRSQEIDGEAMLFLKVEHLMTRLNIKLGPAAKICARLKQLQGEVST